MTIKSKLSAIALLAVALLATLATSSSATNPDADSTISHCYGEPE